MTSAGRRFEPREHESCPSRSPTLSRTSNHGGGDSSLSRVIRLGLNVTAAILRGL